MILTPYMRVKHVLLQNFWRQTIDLNVGTGQKRSDRWEIEYRYHTKSPKSEFDRVLDLQLEKALPGSSPTPITICGFCTINCQSIQYSCETMDLPTWLVPLAHSRLSAESTNKLLTLDPIFKLEISPEPNDGSKNDYDSLRSNQRKSDMISKNQPLLGSSLLARVQILRGADW